MTMNNYRNELYKSLGDLQAQTRSLVELMDRTADDPLTHKLLLEMNNQVGELSETTLQIEDAMSYLREQT